MKPGGRTSWVPLTALCVTAAASMLIGREIGLRTARPLDAQRALRDPAVREDVLAFLANQAEGVFDLHVDPEVGRILQPNLEGRTDGKTLVRTNAFGLRERAFATPKPEGVTRIVLLGDSYVFGSGVEMHERFGARLAELLVGRTGAVGADVECLHLGVSSWNFLTECAYLRRQLALVRPDLVVQVSVANDLSDSEGVRGMGFRGRVVPAHRKRADSLLQGTHPVDALGQNALNHLNEGLDWESRTRFAEALAAVTELATAVEDQGARYQLLLNWGARTPVVHEHLARHLRADQVIYLPRSSFSEAGMVIGSGDMHWSPDGHLRIAHLLYGAIVERDLLPALQPPYWDLAEREFDRLQARGLRDATSSDAILARPPARRLLSPLALTKQTARQVHGGLDSEGLVGVYASFVMPGSGIRSLELEGEYLDRPVLDGATVAVFVEEELVGMLEVRGSGSFATRYAIPPAIGDRAFVTVRLESDDYVYTNARSYSCRVFRLTRLEVR